MKGKILWISIFVASFAASVSLYAVKTHDTFTAVLFFPSSNTSEYVGEPRSIPRKGSLEERITVTVREILLGPYSFEIDRIVSAETKLNSLLLRDDTVYIDLSVDILSSERDVRHPYEIVSAGLQKTVAFNFPTVEEVVVTLGGELPRDN